MKYEVPDRVQKRALNHKKVGESWLASLDTIVDELTRQWELKIGDVLEGGSENRSY